MTVKSPTLAPAPHCHSMFTVSRTMLAVMVCLSPATLFGLYQFGWPAILLFTVTIVSAFTFEILCLALARRPILPFATDGSALLTGWLVAMTLPPWAPWWVGFLGGGIAIVLGKHVFGGLGQNLFNPAMAARAMLLVAVPVQLTMWVDPLPLGSSGAPDFVASLAITFGAATAFDAMSSASVLGTIQSGLDAGRGVSEILAQTPPIETLFLGNVAGSLGETNAALLLGGGICLVLLRIIPAVVPLAVLGSVAGLAALTHLIAPDHFVPPQVHLASGALMLCAFFIATDYVTSPITWVGKLISGLIIGTLIFVIRTWGAFPEGVAFAVLLANACTPLIDAYVRPRIFGRTRSGRPLDLEGAE
ncbi:MAG: RnfABCDGE type electron transport complex subunit D [Pseudomonadota bacterium]